MSLETAGLDFGHCDRAIRPQDDLYRHFSGGWLKSVEIPAEFRCNQILKNFTPFYEAFDVNEKDALWLDQQSRVQIW